VKTKKAAQRAAFLLGFPHPSSFILHPSSFIQPRPSPSKASQLLGSTTRLLVGGPCT
jgi:hypothetical protein